MTPTPPNIPVNAELVAFWVDQLAGLPVSARETMLSALASAHGTRFAERVRDLLVQECAAA